MPAEGEGGEKQRGGEGGRGGPSGAKAAQARGEGRGGGVRAQGFGEFGGGLVAGGGLLGERLGEDGGGGTRFGQDGRRGEQRGEDLGGAGARESRTAGEQFGEDGGEAEDVGAAVEFFASRLLGGHVAGGADHAARLGGVWGGGFAGLQDSGEPEIDDLDEAVGAEHDVFRLDVAMNDAGAVGGIKGGGALEADGEGFFGWEWSGGETLAESDAFDEFGGDEPGIAGLADVEDGEDIGVVEGGGGFGFGLEAGDGGRVVGEFGGEEFQRDEAVEAGIAGAVDFAHGAGAEFAEDQVGAETRACAWRGGAQRGDVLLTLLRGEELAGLFPGFEERRDFAKEIGIAETGLVEEGDAAFREGLDHPLVNLVDEFPTVRIHEGRGWWMSHMVPETDWRGTGREEYGGSELAIREGMVARGWRTSIPFAIASKVFYVVFRFSYIIVPTVLYQFRGVYLP